MQPLATWESLLVGALAILVFFWVKPGIKPALEKSKNAQSDWPAVLIPLTLVILFIVLLISSVKS